MNTARSQAVSRYTRKQVEEMASDLRQAPATSMLGTHVSVPAPKAVAMYEALCAYASTLPDEGASADQQV